MTTNSRAHDPIQRFLGVLLIVAVATGWGSTGVFALMLREQGWGPLPIALSRMTIALLPAGLLARLPSKPSAQRSPRPLPWLALTMSGVLGFAVFQVTYIAAIHLAGMGLGAILLYTKPIFVVLLAQPLLGERLTAVKMIAVAMVFTGIALIADVPRLLASGVSEAPWPGVVAGTLAGLLAACFALTNKLLLKQLHPYRLNFWNLLIACTSLWIGIGVAWLVGTPLPFLTPSGSATVAEVFRTLGSTLPALSGRIVAMGLVTTFLPYLFYILALQRLGAGEANVIAGLEPFAAVLFGMALFGERLSPWELTGGILVLAAAALIAVAGDRPVESKTVTREPRLSAGDEDQEDKPSV